MNLFLALAVAAFLGADPAPEPEAVYQAVERTLTERPLEAIQLVRQAAPQLQGRPDLLKRLWTLAARLQEPRLATLSEAQVQELGDVYEANLAEAAAAARIRRLWLKERLEKAPAEDGAGRLQLARLWLRWLGEREEATRLAREAIRLAPAIAHSLQLSDVPLLGPPRRVTRQVLYQRYLEQRFYDGSVPLLIEVEHKKGLEPQILPVRLLEGQKS